MQSKDSKKCLNLVKQGRMQTGVPGNETVGIEQINDNKSIYSPELPASDEFAKCCGTLMLLGKDISGNPVMADLESMPHMLVAGNSYSMFLNNLLVSLFYRMYPSDMQLLLVNLRHEELRFFDDEPHLVHPVVTEMNEVRNALNWAVLEMDRRYEAMSRLGVRDMAGFNQKLATYKTGLPPDLAGLEPLPYLVIVIDELADLMMAAAREAENTIVRLAQQAHAAGIHMILATERPSVDVVTGLIKANFPSRIAFQVSSRHTLHAIIGQAGVEHLLGRGDMLYKSRGGRVQCLHDSSLSDEKVQAVVEYWKQHMKPSYKVDFVNNSDCVISKMAYIELKAELYEEGFISIAMIQRKMMKRYGKKIPRDVAADLIGKLEDDCVVEQYDRRTGRANARYDSDPLYRKIKKFMFNKSVLCFIIRKQFGISCNRAHSLVDQLEMDGYINSDFQEYVVLDRSAK